MAGTSPAMTPGESRRKARVLIHRAQHLAELVENLSDLLLAHDHVRTGDMGDSVRGHRGHSCGQTSRTRESSMPWRERLIVDQREEFVKLALAPGANRRELCSRFGISRSKGYKWLGRYATQGRTGLADRSRRPHHSPTRTCEAVEAAVLRIREDSNDAWGGRKIAQVLKRDRGQIAPAPSTITQILR